MPTTDMPISEWKFANINVIYTGNKGHLLFTVDRVASRKLFIIFACYLLVFPNTDLYVLSHVPIAENSQTQFLSSEQPDISGLQ